MIRVTQLKKAYSQGIIRKTKKEVLRGVSFSIEKGETYGLLGPSGSGKSTLARILLGLTSYDEGSVEIAGKEVKALIREDRKTFARHNQMMYQFPQEILNPFYTIKEAFKEVGMVHLLDKAYMLETIPRLLRKVGLDESVLARRPNQLSGGQLQRIALSRILLLKPSFLILDEPTAMLDSVSSVQIMTLLREIQREEELTYLFISHDEDMLRAVSDKVGKLKEGMLYEE